MRRREFIILFGGAIAWPLAADAQQAIPLIGYLGARTFYTDAHLVDAFQKGLRETDYVIGKNVDDARQSAQLL
jgi:putative tryptophan/tyrosine transport system substrate-binding protein